MGNHSASKRQVLALFARFYLLMEMEDGVHEPLGVGIQWPDGTCHVFWPDNNSYGIFKSIEAVLKDIPEKTVTVEWLDDLPKAVN
jgi:hypothetical protein